MYAYGARSFSIWAADGTLVFDSGDDFEQITADLLPDDFNSTNSENDSFDSRSDDKGPEPEGVAIAELYSKTYAFIGLEPVGGVMVYDVTTPKNPKFVQYVNNRDFDGDAEDGTPVTSAPKASPSSRPRTARTARRSSSSATRSVARSRSTRSPVPARCADHTHLR
ncbi:MAG: hypothetical protein WKF60_06015 [Ilumatobacter sp.]